MNPKNALQNYFSELTTALPLEFTPEAFEANQLLPLLAKLWHLKLSRKITYYIEELDALETIPASMLAFKGVERIDDEHFFLFYEGSSGDWYNPLLAAKQVLRAIVAIVPISGLMRLLVQHVDAIPVTSFERDHQDFVEQRFALAS